MKLKKQVLIDVDAVAVRVVAPIRYGEEDMPNDAPFRTGDIWDVTIDLDSGVILNWPQGKTLKIRMKVCDMGVYHLLGADEGVIASIDHDSVPWFFPGQHYGDYLDFDIDAGGKIAGWRAKAVGVQYAFGLLAKEE